jgi:putative hydrolase of the HAD superfamily
MKLNILPEESLMVGDWVERDILGASLIGMKTAFAKYGDTFNTREHKADYELNDISELIEIIANQNKSINNK